MRMVTGRDLDRLVDDHKSLVYGLIHRLVADRDAHDELFQDVFLSVFRSLPGYRGGAKLSTWIGAVTVNVCRDHLRKTLRTRVASLDEWLERNGDPPSPAGAAGAPVPAELRTDLEMRLDRLPPKYRIPLWLFYFEGQRYEDIAAALGLPLGTVKTHLFRGLRRLREEMEGERP